MEDTRAALVASIRAEIARADTSGVKVAAGIGMPHRTWVERMAGRVPFSAEEIVRIAEHLGVPTERLLGGGR